MKLTINTRYTLEAPQGKISDDGVWDIVQFLQSQRLESDDWKAANPDNQTQYLPGLPEDWQWVWVVKGRGEYVGTLTKRIRKFYYKEHNLNVPDSVITELGNIAKRHTEDSAIYEFEFVDEFDWNAGDFGDRGSCYWGGNRAARMVLRDNGAWAVRFYERGQGKARAWVAVIGSNLYIVFNGYGFASYPTLTIARVLATFLNLHYKKISLTNYGRNNGVVWINSGTGFAVGTIAQLDNLTTFDLKWGEDDYYSCDYCGEALSESEVFYAPDDGLPYCQACYEERYEYCEICGEDHWHEDMRLTGDHEYVCDYCLERHFTECATCGNYFRNDSMTVTDDAWYCDTCYEEKEQADDSQASD